MSVSLQSESTTAPPHSRTALHDEPSLPVGIAGKRSDHRSAVPYEVSVDISAGSQPPQSGDFPTRKPLLVDIRRCRGHFPDTRQFSGAKQSGKMFMDRVVDPQLLRAVDRPTLVDLIGDKAAIDRIASDVSSGRKVRRFAERGPGLKIPQQQGAVRGKDIARLDSGELRAKQRGRDRQESRTSQCGCGKLHRL